MPKNVGEEVVFADNRVGLAFPRQLGGLSFQVREQFEPKSMGYSLRYAGGSDLRADVYIYDLQMPSIPDGIVSPLIEEQLSEVEKVLKILEQRGVYKGVRLVTRGVAPGTGVIPFAWSKHEYVQIGKAPRDISGPQVSQTLITGYHKAFVKVRLTYPTDKRSDADKPAADFITALSGLMASSEKTWLGTATNPSTATTGRQPSTPEQRRKAVELCVFLENEPFSANGRELRATLLRFIEEMPDINVTAFGSMLGDEKFLKDEQGPILFAQELFSMGRFIMENSRSAGNEVAIQIEGIEGVLRTYENMKRQKPGFQLEQMERLIKLKAEGKLKAHVEAVMKKDAEDKARK